MKGDKWCLHSPGRRTKYAIVDEHSVDWSNRANDPLEIRHCIHVDFPAKINIHFCWETWRHFLNYKRKAAVTSQKYIKRGEKLRRRHGAKLFFISEMAAVVKTRHRRCGRTGWRFVEETFNEGCWKSGQGVGLGSSSVACHHLLTWTNIHAARPALMLCYDINLFQNEKSYKKAYIKTYSAQVSAYELFRFFF